MAWLLAGDPAIRWQVLRDLTDAPAEEVDAERTRVASEGWGADLLARQAEDGTWGGGAYHPSWTSTTFTLLDLRRLGLDPEDPRAQEAVARVADQVRMEFNAEQGLDVGYFEGEVETCINGMVAALGAYFGRAHEPLVARLLGEQLPDGGWNCWAGEAWPDDETDRSSFHTTISVLEGLLEHERAVGPDAEITAARERGTEYLLARRMHRRASTGEIVRQEFTRFAFPPRWHYDVLRGLDHLRDAGVRPDDRTAEAIAMVRDRRGADGRWLAEPAHPGEVHLELDAPVGSPSRWNTLRALRVLRWADSEEQP